MPEIKRDINIEIKEEDLKIIHILHHYTEGRLNFILKSNKYSGNIKINEPEKCEKIGMV